MSEQQADGVGSRIAVVGMSGRFAGSSDVDALWRNLRDGVECIERYDEEALLQAGVSRALLDDPSYVRAGAPLPDMEKFDAEFFGLTPLDASIMDPQHRHFLECSWEGFEHAGIDPARFEGSVGVFAGCGYGAYMAQNLLTNPEVVDQVGFFLLRHTGNDKDFLSTRVSFEFDLKGPSISVQTACSTSLVAIHLACQGLLNGECDLALAGGTTIELPHRQGYLYRPGEIPSPDGHCRPFDAAAAGTVFGSGLGVVLLRRLEDAVADGDPVLAVILGSAVANDGAGKAGYLAPSVDGQTHAISEALALAEVEPRSIGFVECMGSGTALGDAIEVDALTRAFRQGTDAKGFCAIGSLKPNVGHTDTAAGVAGFIKTVQALRHAQIPPTLHFESPNPDLHLDQGPFYVNAALEPWERQDAPRRAGVSSLGIGGTNAHIVLEEAPAREASGPSRDVQLLLLSGRSENVVQRASDRLADHLRSHPETPLADVAHTLRVGRRHFRQRRAVVCHDAQQAIRLLEEQPPEERLAAGAPASPPSLTFLFPGDGAQHPGMASDLYARESFYRDRVDECLALLAPDAREAVRAFVANGSEAPLEDASLGLAALFIVEWSLARLLQHWGLVPAALAGHGVGEITAACVAEGIGLADALRLVCGGAPPAASALAAPQIPVLSNRTGEWLSEQQATDPQYWAEGLRSTVHSADDVAALLDDPNRQLLEVGPGRMLSALARVHPATHASAAVLQALPHPDESGRDLDFLLETLGRLWTAGVEIDWNAFDRDETRHRVGLPSYPWQHQRHWIEPGAAGRVGGAGPLAREDDVSRWLQGVSWSRTPRPAATSSGAVVVFLGDEPLSLRIVEALRSTGRRVLEVREGSRFEPDRGSGFRIRPGEAVDVEALLEALGDPLPRDFLHLWNLGATGADDEHAAEATRAFSSPVSLAKALGLQDGAVARRLHLVTASIHAVGGEEPGAAVQALSLGPCRVIPAENPSLRCRNLDVWTPPAGSPQEARLASALAAEIGDAPDDVVSLRGRDRFVPGFAPIAPGRREAAPELRDGGVYLITGGLGGLGLELARYLARQTRARLALVSRAGLPPREAWQTLLADAEAGDPLARRVRAVQEIEAAGGEVEVYAADVCDAEALRGVVGAVEQRFGALHGVVHAAGVLDEGLIEFKSLDAMERVLAPRVSGVLALDAALAGRALDFLWLYSSVGSWAGLPGQVDLSAASAYLDAFARQRSDRADGGPTLSIGWGTWQGVGSVAELARQAESTPGAGEEIRHPLLQERRSERGSSELYVSLLGAEAWGGTETAGDTGVSMLPGAAYLEMARAALASKTGDTAVELRGVLLLSPFRVEDGETRELRVRLDRASGDFAVASPAAAQSGDGFVEHARGSVAAFAEAAPPEPRAIPALRAECAEKTLEGKDANSLLQFGLWAEFLKRVGIGSEAVLAEFELGDGIDASRRQGLTPVLIDMATGCGQVLLEDHDPSRDLLVPISYGRVVLRGPLPARFCSHLRLRSGAGAGEDFAIFEGELLDDSGQEVARIEELMCKRIRDAASLASEAPPMAADPDEFGDRAGAASASVLADDLHLAIRPEEGIEAIERLLALKLDGHVLVSPRPIGAWLEQLSARADAGRPRSERLDPATRAEVQQVEEATRELPGVVEIAISVHFDRPGQRRLLAHVVWDPAHAGTVSELRRALRKQLSDDRVPQNFVELDALPRTASGEVDLDALDDPFGITDDFVAPRTPTEKTLARIWKQVLGIDRVGLHDNFLDIGGHSVLAMRVIVRLAKELGVRLKNSTMVLQTLEQAAAECDRQLGRSDTAGPEDEAGAPERKEAPGGLLGALRRGLGRGRSA